MSKILELERLMGYVISEIDFFGISPTDSVSYSWGDKYELNQWIVMKDKEVSGKRAFGLVNKAKYPLIWLITPIEGEVLADENIFRDVQVVIATDTKAEWLNSTREAQTMPFLTKIANHFIEGLGLNENISLVRGTDGSVDLKFKKVYNYQDVNDSSENSNKTLDIWDAIVLKFGLRINNNCLKNIELCL